MKLQRSKLGQRAERMRTLEVIRITDFLHHRVCWLDIALALAVELRGKLCALGTGRSDIDVKELQQGVHIDGTGAQEGSQSGAALEPIHAVGHLAPEVVAFLKK